MEAGKKKKKSIEETRAYNRERQRERRKKFSEEQLAAKRDYDKKEKKEKGLWKKVSDLTHREARKIRRQTRERTRRCREKKKIENATEENPTNDCATALQSRRGSSRKEVGRKKKILSRTKVYLDLLKAKNREDTQRRLAQKYKQKYQRLKSKIQQMSTPSPNTKVKRLCGNIKVPSPVRKKLIFSEILTSHLEKKKQSIGNQKELNEFSRIVSPKELKKQRMVGAASKIVSYKLYRKSIENKGRKESLKKINQSVLVRRFLELDVNSRMCPGKRDYKTNKKVKRQKRILLDSLKNLHLKFIRDYNMKIGLTTFRKLRPFNIVPPRLSDRDTCLCLDHANTKLVVDKLYLLQILSSNSLSKIAEMTCCSTNNKKCMYRQCEKCSNKLVLDLNGRDVSKFVSYRQWTKHKEDRHIKGETKTIRFTAKSTLECTLHDLLDVFWKQLNKITPHMFDIFHQYKQMRQLKNTLSDKEVIVRMDFSENYVTKHSSEPQSLHFGASKKQLSLHTVVCYHPSFPNKVKSFCTVSSNLDHAAYGVWAHLSPVLKDVCKSNPQIETLHFQSDGPSSQYKNKNNLYLLTYKLLMLFPFIKKWTWNYSISGHGKGPMDGIGGTIKRTADTVVLHGQDVTSTKDVIEKVGPLCPKINLIEIDSKEFLWWKSQLPSNLPVLKGIQKVHQMLWQKANPFKIEIRSLSCMICKFQFCKHYHLSKELVSYEVSTLNEELPEVSHNAQAEILFDNKPRAPKTTKPVLCDNDQAFDCEIKSPYVNYKRKLKIRKIHEEQKDNVSENKNPTLVPKTQNGNICNTKYSHFVKPIPKFKYEKVNIKVESIPQPCCSKDVDKEIIELGENDLQSCSDFVGLCYKCGSNFKTEDSQKRVQCDICDKAFHTRCVNNINFDEPKYQPIYMCEECAKFNGDIVEMLNTP